MSGIAAIYDPAGELTEREDLQALLGAIRHRGTSEFTWSTPQIWLGERLLPTTPEAIHEGLPLTAAGGRYQIAFDGRLDNRTDLVAALSIDSPERLLTDPELVVQAYKKWGESFLLHILGDFAFVLWHSTHQRLIAGRDQRGFRPLCYARRGHQLIFGSEPQQLLTLPGVPATLDQVFLACHLTGALPPRGVTPYAAITDIPPGQYLIADEHGVRMKEYFRFEPRRQLHYSRQEDYVDHFEAVFGEVTSALTRSLGRPSVFLSGDLDSSYVLARAIETGLQPTGIYAFARDTKAMDERPHTRAVAAQLGVPLTEIEINDCWSFSTELLPDAAFDQPNVPMQSALMRHLAKAASQNGSQVILDGAGGGELMGGSGSYFTDLLLAGRLGVTSRDASAWAGSAGLPMHRIPLRGGVLPVSNALTATRYRCNPSPLPPWIDALALWATGLSSSLVTASAASIWSRADQLQSFWSDLISEVQPAFAWRERWASLPNQLETRSPFWDLRVVELCRQMPSWVHRRAGQNHALLHSVMKARLPAQIVERRDKGVFDELVERGLRNERSTRVEPGVAALSSLLYLDWQVLEAQVMALDQAPTLWRHGLYRAVSAGLWLKTNSLQCIGPADASSSASSGAAREGRSSYAGALAKLAGG